MHTAALGEGKPFVGEAFVIEALGQFGFQHAFAFEIQKAQGPLRKRVALHRPAPGPFGGFLKIRRIAQESLSVHRGQRSFGKGIALISRFAHPHHTIFEVLFDDIPFPEQSS